MIRKEKIVCEQLKQWFEGCGVECWMNEGEKKFTTKISQKKPDLLIYSSMLNKYIAIEVKIGDSARELHEASKIIDYYKEYINEGIEYYIDGDVIRIDGFAIASLYSMFGKLFKEEGMPIHVSQNSDPRWGTIVNQYSMEPKWEFPRSRDYLRNLWAVWRRFRERKNLPGLGLILSDILNKEKPNGVGTPIIFAMFWDNKKNRWKVQQRIL